MTMLPIIASRACKSFVFGPMPSMLSAKFFKSPFSHHVQHLPETCAEMCRPSSKVAVVPNTARMSSFFLWKKPTNSIPLPAFRYSNYDLRLTFFLFSDVQSFVLPATYPVAQWRRTFHSILGYTLPPSSCIYGWNRAPLVLVLVGFTLFSALMCRSLS